MFKKILASVLSIAALGLVTTAQADNTPPKPASRAVVVPPSAYKFLITTIKGDITVPQTFSASGYGQASSLAGFQCSNLIVVANSKETKPRPPNATGLWIDEPVWSRSVHASGTWSSGKCSYSMAVPGDQQFRLTAGDQGNFNCSNIMIDMSGTPSWQSVPKSTVKTDNLFVKSVTCNIIG